MSTTDWIAVDWGTSNMRLWRMSGGTVQERRSSDAGMGTLDRDGFEPALLSLLPDLPEGPTEIVVCGMAGSRQGWAEAPYASVPCLPPSARQAVRVQTRDPRLSVYILPGVKQQKPADVMRGEETQIAGFLALNPEFDGVICLPGTHCKWAHISAGEIVSFRTFMTGELFALLSRSSVLRHSIAARGWDQPAFLEACEDAMTRPASFASGLFALRAEGLVGDLPPEVARARLSGLLIGIEIGAAKPYWLGRNVALVGDDALVAPYRAALEKQGVPVTITDAERMTLEGLKSAYASFKETAS